MVLENKVEVNLSIKNPCFSAIPDVNDICMDYFEALNLDLHFFGHISVFPDGNFNFLCSKRDWPTYSFVKEKVPPAGFTIYNQIENSIKLPHIDTGADLGWSDEMMKISKERFKIENLMIIFRKYEDHYEGFAFDLHDKRSHEKYINNLDLFENFIFYYKDKARNLIKMASKNRLQVDRKYLIQNPTPEGTSGIITKNILNPRQYFLAHNEKDYSISKREYQCLELISHGKKIKDLSDSLDISPRTIDTHLNSVKRKLNTKKIVEAVDIYWRNRIRGARYEP